MATRPPPLEGGWWRAPRQAGGGSGYGGTPATPTPAGADAVRLGLRILSQAAATQRLPAAVDRKRRPLAGVVREWRRRQELSRGGG
jgi:hypothetical protein